jgi:uncharacterized protein (TIGR00251 family)
MTRQSAQRASGGPISPRRAAVPDSVIRDRAEGATVVIVATPKAGVDAVGPVEGDALRVRVTAAAVDGAANAAIVKLLAETAGVPRSRVRVVAGHCARRKHVLFEGIPADELSHRLGLASSLGGATAP